MTDTAARAQAHGRRLAARADTRSRILAAARELIPNAGLSLPVTAIARHAGVAIQTVYDQFGSKGGLLVAAVIDAQRSTGLYAAFGEVFRSPDGETAMRRMLAATVTVWHDAWPFVEFTLRSRRSDPIVASEMDKLDRLRFAHFEAIVQRFDDEGRLRRGTTVAQATARAFALSTATVYEEVAVRRPGSLGDAVDAITEAVLGAILEPGAVALGVPPPDWQALESAAAARAQADGARAEQLSPRWFGAGRKVPGGDPADIRPAEQPRKGTARPPR